MKLIRRTGIIFLWVVALAICLYFPKWNLFPTEEKSINVFTWGNILSPTILSKFEKKTGIKVNLSYYSSNEELQVKMIATNGEGYDVIMPSDYTAQSLIAKQLVKPLAREKIQFWDRLNPLLLNLSYDPGNRYSIPFEYEIYGLGIDTDYFKTTPFVPSWKAIYDRNVINYRIAAQNDPVEAVAIAALYLFGTTKNISEDQLTQIRNLLKEQRNWVEAYSDSRAPYFIVTGNCPVAMTTSTYIRKMVSLNPAIDFIIPREGSFISIENFCLSKGCQNEDLVYELLNFLYREESIKTHFFEFGLIPAYLLPFEQLASYPYEKRLFAIDAEEFARFRFFTNIAPQQEIRDIWVDVKSF